MRTIGRPGKKTNICTLSSHRAIRELYAKVPSHRALAFRKLPSIYVFSYFPFGFKGRMWDLIELVPDHCLSFYFTTLCEGSMRIELRSELYAKGALCGST